MRAGLPAILPDGVGKRTPCFDTDWVRAAVNGQGNVCFRAHAAFPLVRSAARIRCGVAGISSISASNDESASLMALMIAAGAPIAPPSPRPLALVIELGLGVSRWCNSIGGISCAVGGR